MLLTIVTFLIILSLLILIHELGHFLLAKKSGIKVEEFGFGLPPRLWGKKKGETIYSINALPLGGFVKLFGEDEQPTEGDGQQAKRSFAAKPILVRMAVVTAGVIANFLLAVVLLTIALSLGVLVWTDQVHVTQILAGSPAAQVGLQVGDVIKSVNSRLLEKSDQLTGYISDHKGQEITLAVIRGQNAMEFAVVPRQNPPSGEGPLGVAVSNFAVQSYPVWEAPVVGVKEAWGLTIAMLNGLGWLVGQLLSGSVPQDAVAGPVGIASITSHAVEMGFATVVHFTAILSLNLAIINILPLPALDGGRFFFLVLEAIFRRPVAPKLERYIHAVGLAVLIGLLVIITYNDIIKLTKVN